MNRRQFLGYGISGSVAVGLARALDNVVLGYGGLGQGTNLVEQRESGDLDRLMAADMQVGRTPIVFRGDTGAFTLRVRDDKVIIRDQGTVGTTTIPLSPEGIHQARRADRERRTDGTIEAIVRDTIDLREGAYRFEYHPLEEFRSRVEESEPRPPSTTLLRGYGSRPISPSVLERFTGVDPRQTMALVDGLLAGFREYGYYDGPRYVAGSIQDNILMGLIDLREPLETRTDFESMVDREATGLFCWELARRAMEAMHVYPGSEQSVPVAATYVRDVRHKHVYNGLSTVTRSDGRVVIPTTFVDYTRGLLVDDLRATAITGEGLNAYDGRHRTTEVRWNVF